MSQIIEGSFPRENNCYDAFKGMLYDIFCMRKNNGWLLLRSHPFLRARTRARCNRLLAIALLTLLATLSALCIPAHSLQPAQPTVLALEEPADANAQVLLQQGITLYEAERFAEAAAIWQQALPQLAPMYQAFALSNLSLAYQQLGQWQAAEQSIASSLSLLQSQPPGASEQIEIQAKALNTHARLQWFLGRQEDALETWQQAAIAYTQAGDETGTIIALINRANALQTLGFTVRAEESLQTVYQVLNRQDNPNLRVAGLRSLGNALRRTGKLTESRSRLQESLQVVEAADLSTAKAAVLLDLGNTERALAERAIAIGKTEAAQLSINAALDFYEQAARAATTASLRLEADLNQFSLRAKTAPSTAIALIPVIQQALADLPQGRGTIYARLNFAHALQTQFVGPNAERSNPSTPSVEEIAQLLATTIKQAQSLQDAIAESYALGQLGELYEITQQWTEATSLTEQALLKIENLQKANVRYRWEWQLGRLQTKQGDRSSALASYAAAVDSLKSIRSDLLLLGSDEQFSFRDDVEPVYREFVELLLTPEAGAQPSQENLKQAIQRIDALQLVELENFLGCNLAQTVAITDVEQDPTAAKIYPMILPQRLAVVLELPGQDQPLQYHEILQPRQVTEDFLRQLRRHLREPDGTPEAIAGLQEVYRWLIAPFKEQLSRNAEISTLVFVLDSELRNMPMAALYDGQQYLVSNYAVALAPRLELFNPSPRPQRLNVFLGGVDEPQTFNNQSFARIANLIPELESIRQLVNADALVLNTNFTKTNLEQQLSSGRFSAIHLKTHGVFSSDPDETFIVAYKELITGRDLGQLIQARRAGEAGAVELLVLSACSTATGDNRAVLGLAGVAVQAGARTAISTLWEAQDLPNTRLMIQFYRELLNPTTTRAQALRAAQLYLLNQGYRAPHVWATYVLVGNWL